MIPIIISRFEGEFLSYVILFSYVESSTALCRVGKFIDSGVGKYTGKLFLVIIRRVFMELTSPL